MSSMKAETLVIRSTVHNLLLQWMEYLLLQLWLVEPKHDFDEFISEYFHQSDQEKACVLINPFQEYLCI